MSIHEFKVYGLVERDYRSELEIASLKNDGIYILEVAEVENLFLVEDMLKVMASRFGVFDVEQTIKDVEDFVINTKFTNMINKQICQSVVAEIKYQLSCVEISKKDDADAKATLQAGLDRIKYDEIKSQKETVFLKALNDKNYGEVLKVFNEKGIAAEIGRFFGVDNREYRSKVISLLYSDYKDEIIGAMKRYLPSEIPR